MPGGGEPCPEFGEEQLLGLPADAFQPQSGCHVAVARET